MATDISSASDDHTGGPAKDAGSPSPHAGFGCPAGGAGLHRHAGRHDALQHGHGSRDDGLARHGFVRTAVLAAASGHSALGDAYNVAYTIPLILSTSSSAGS